MDEITNALKSLKMPGMAHYWTTITEKPPLTRSSMMRNVV